LLIVASHFGYNLHHGTFAGSTSSHWRLFYLGYFEIPRQKDNSFVFSFGSFCCTISFIGSCSLKLPFVYQIFHNVQSCSSSFLARLSNFDSSLPSHFSIRPAPPTHLHLVSPTTSPRYTISPTSSPTLHCAHIMLIQEPTLPPRHILDYRVTNGCFACAFCDCATPHERRRRRRRR
jgi:hypothetical protein